MARSRFVNFAKTITIGALIATLAFIAVPARAADDSNQKVEITMSPVSTRLDIQPNEKYDGQFTVLNSGNVGYDIKVYAAPYQVINPQYEPNFSTDNNYTQIAKWVTFDQDSYHMDAGQTLTVPYHINVPADVPDGGQYAVLFAETQPMNEQINGSSVDALRRVGMLVYAQVPGTTRVDGKVIETNLEFWQKSAPLVASQTIENTGNTDFEVTVNYEVKTLFGKSVHTNENLKKVVLPGTNRDIVSSWDDAPSFGLFKVSQTAEFLGQTSTNSGWVLIAAPWMLVVAVLIIVLIIGVIVYAIHRKKNRSKKIAFKR